VKGIPTRCNTNKSKKFPLIYSSFVRLRIIRGVQREGVAPPNVKP